MVSSPIVLSCVILSPLSLSALPLYELIWKGHYPKKIKFFLRELSHKTINTHEKFQRRLPHMVLSPHWCSMCKSILNLKVTYWSLVHLQDPFGTTFFLCSIVKLSSRKTLISSSHTPLVGPPSKRRKR